MKLHSFAAAATLVSALAFGQPAPRPTLTRAAFAQAVTADEPERRDDALTPDWLYAAGALLTIAVVGLVYRRRTKAPPNQSAAEQARSLTCPTKPT